VSTESTRGNLTRRHALAGAATVGLGLPLLAACGGGSATDPSGSATSPGGTKPGGSGALTTTSDIPVGGGTIFPDEKVVITQPTQGEFKGFSATCTHQGCTVGSVASGTIDCPCHNSMFSITDGSVQGGPASVPLPEVPISVDGNNISLA
jgi:Rieske Fe-S protein